MSMAIQRAKYTGDPGLFGDIFSGIKGAVSGGIRGFTGLGRQPSVPQAGPGGIRLGPVSLNLPFAGQPGMGATVLPLFGTTPASTACPAGMGSMGGYHLNKSDYFLRSGEFVPKGSRWVRNRKRNPANARATSRAISRVVGAKRYASSLSRVSIRKRK